MCMIEVGEQGVEAKGGLVVEKGVLFKNGDEAVVQGDGLGPEAHVAEETAEHGGGGELHVVVAGAKVEKVLGVEGEGGYAAEGLGTVDGRKDGDVGDVQETGGVVCGGDGGRGERVQGDDVAMVHQQRRLCEQEIHLLVPQRNTWRIYVGL